MANTPAQPLATANPAHQLPAPGESRRERELWLHQEFLARAQSIREGNARQQLADADRLAAKYAAPIFGQVAIWPLIERMAQIIDPVDTYLLCASQRIHMLQILDALEADGMASQDFIIAALVHDLGKLALLTGEVPENLCGITIPLGKFTAGAGLDNNRITWSNDEISWARLRPYLPEHLAWLVRYHSIHIERCKPLMDARDLDYVQRYLIPFRHYDMGSKSAYWVPRRNLEDYRPLLEQAFPPTITF